MEKISIIPHHTTTKCMQVVNSVILEIEKGTLKKDEQLPSITIFSKEYGLSRDTVERAYKELIIQGYIKAIKGRGNYILGTQDARLKILLIVNKLSSYKKIIYDAFLHELGDKARVDLYVHHYNPQLLKEIIDENLGNYHYYAVMPHFFHDAEQEDYINLLQRIPVNQLLLLDKELPELAHQGMGIYQNFKEDIYKALQSAKELLNKYKRIIVVFPEHSNHPIELNEGVLQFCVESKKQFSVISSTENENLQNGTAYIVLTDWDLAVLGKQAKAKKYVLGKDIGILSFNETALKELLDITVVTTDFEQMGKSAAELILKNKCIQIKNPFYLIKRRSL